LTTRCFDERFRQEIDQKTGAMIFHRTGLFFI
jgi:hypothetical protein